MTRKTLAALLAVVLAGGISLADDQTVKEKAEELVSQLGSDDAAAREKATDELSKLGPEAIPVLEEAAQSKDPEVQWRAEKAIAKIKEGAQPKTEVQEDGGRPKQKRQPGGFSSSIRIQIGGPGSVSIQRDGNGHVRVTVTEEDEKGEKVSKSYEADSAAEFKEKYPEVAKKYGIDDEGTAPQVILPPGLEDMDELLKDMPARLQEMLKRLQQGGGLIPGQRKRPPEPEPPAPVEPEPAQPPAAPRGEVSTPDEFGAEVSFIDEALR
ncbi:MAG: HEAT repeat domain-containing protein, partial [Planctomycetota bacterium]